MALLLIGIAATSCGAWLHVLLGFRLVPSEQLQQGGCALQRCGTERSAGACWCYVDLWQGLPPSLLLLLLLHQRSVLEACGKWRRHKRPRPASSSSGRHR